MPPQDKSFLPSAQYGTVPVTGAATARIVFARPFKTVPKLIVQTSVPTCSGGVYSAAIIELSTTSATVVVAQVYSKGSMDSGLTISFVAWESQPAQLQGAVDGSFTVTINNASQLAGSLTNISMNGAPFAASAMVLYSAMIPSPKMAAVVAASMFPRPGTGKAVVNAQLVTAKASVTEPFNITFTWVAFKQYAVQYPVASTSSQPNISVVEGPLLTEVQQVFRQHYAQTWRLWSNANSTNSLAYVEIAGDIGPIDAGRELVSRFSSDLATGASFFPDSNGLDTFERVYRTDVDEPVAGNYYPMVQRAFIKDADSREKPRALTLLSDRAHGTASLEDGELEIMLHRRCLKDDSKGVGEVLNEQDHIQPSLWLLLDGPEESAQLSRRYSLLQNFPAQPMSVRCTTKNLRHAAPHG